MLHSTSNICFKQKINIVFFEKYNSLNQLTIKHVKTSNLETFVKMSVPGLGRFSLPLFRNGHNRICNSTRLLR